MADERLARLRPRDLATVWGTTFGQVVDLWRSVSVALLEAGSGERDILDTTGAQIVVPAIGGRLPRLIARDLVGESFGLPLDSQLVTFTESGPAGPDLVLVECRVHELQGQPIRGDIYRGRVEDERGVLIARIALDAGS